MTAPTRPALALQRCRRRHRAVADLRTDGQRRGARIRPAGATGCERGCAPAGHLRVGRATSCRTAKPSPAIVVLMCGGWTPSVHLYSQSRARLRFDERSAGVPARRMRTAQVRSAGACNGTFGLAACLEEGYARRRRRSAQLCAADARAVLRSASHCAACRRQRQGIRRFPERRHRQGPRASPRRKASARSSTSSATPPTGMATDQGKTSNMNALAMVAGLTGSTDAGGRATPRSACPTRR